jgi:methylenetetrahydrofolate dehydrogenase (NADP+)/methenyltetrahydrofolate cyclohydrolase
LPHPWATAYAEAAVTAAIIDGRAIAAEIRAELRERVERLRQRGVTPGLAFVLVGENPASISYVRSKAQACEEIAIHSETIRLSAETSQEELLALVAKLNADPPPHISEDAVARAIDPGKDVDALNPVNMGLLLRGEPAFLSCTPAGIQQLLLRSGNDPAGKHVVICGRSNIVGKPLAAILMQKRPGANATVTICHTGTRDLAAITRQADILVAAMGVPRGITADMVKEGAVVIDVGNNRVPDASRKSGTRMVGDVDFEAVAGKAAAITPVPGGVGPMTVTMLLWNTVQAAERAAGKE